MPYHELHVSPVSCGGIEPAQLTRIRYCDSTTRRSSSAARGSVLPAKSTAPPLVQYAAQNRSPSARACPNDGSGPDTGSAANAHTSSIDSPSRAVSSSSCADGRDSSAGVAHASDAW